MSLPPKVSRATARLRRISPLFWCVGLALMLALGAKQRAWTGPLAFLLCAVSVTTGLAGLVALLFSEDPEGNKEHDPNGVTLGLLGVLGAFAVALAAAIATPSE